MIPEKHTLTPVEEFKPWAYQFRRGILTARTLEEVQGIASILVTMVEHCEEVLEESGFEKLEWRPFELLKEDGVRSVISGLRHPSFYFGKGNSKA